MLLVSLGATLAEAKVDFVAEIRPIFERRCYECHGPQRRKGGFRLSNRKDAFLPGEFGQELIAPSRSADSELLRLISSSDPAGRMPRKRDPLSEREIELIRRWIDEGAEWPVEADRPARHWAYVAPVRPAIPAVRDASWPRNAIDHFVAQRLEREGLAPSPRADEATLVRRLHLDLIGLPPSPAEIDAYVADPSPDKYERLVDRLLASKHYGERWASPWLDLARYADSTGFQSDQLRESWAYRDWVIDALNADMPFDRFTIEQVAGDLLPRPTVKQKVATGFSRAAPLNVEMGVHPEQARVDQVVDRVNLIGTIWLGSTIGCAQCHDHKFDPFSQADYYGLFSFFNNTPLEVRSVGGVTYDPAGPKIDLPWTAADVARQTELRERVAALRAEVEDEATARERQAAWEQRMAAAVAKPIDWRTLEVTAFASSGGEEHRVLPDGSVLVGGTVPGTSTYTVQVTTPLSGITAFKLEALTDPSLPGTGPGRADDKRPDFELTELRVEWLNGHRRDPVSLHTPVADFAEKGQGVARAIDDDGTTSWSIAEQFGTPHWATFLTRGPVGESADGATRLVFYVEQNGGFGSTIGRLRLSASADDPDRLMLPPDFVKILRAKQRTPWLQTRLDRYYKLFTATAFEIAWLEGLLARSKPPSAPVMEEMGEQRATHVLMRGDYLKPGARVAPATPKALHPFSDDLPRNRLGLAHWLVDARNPLVARATVNRWWAQLLGRGLVTTPEDLGTQGTPPSHPELLDWLAVELVEGGWSMKHVVQQIVLSATYQQSSRVTPEMLERDPRNELLARAPRLRLTAEQVRDNALAISGLLTEGMAGPPIYPPQPPDLWRHVGRHPPRYNVARDADRFRRGVYVVWRRVAHYPSFVNFDAPDRSSCVVARSRTNTPLQALTLMNDEAYVEMALGLARRMLASDAPADPGARIAYGFRLCTGRAPTAEEVRVVARVLEAQRARLAVQPDDAVALIDAAATFVPVERRDAQELAAWFLVANLLLNLDETITRS